MLRTIGDHCETLGYAAAGHKPQENVVFSPVSSCMALGMLAAGVSNDAEKELTTLLGAPLSEVHSALKGYADTLRAFNTDPASIKDNKLPARPAIHRANQVVVSTKFVPNPDFLSKVKSFYDSDAVTADLASPQAKTLLDKWVNQHTGGRVKRSAIAPNALLRLVLQDAVLFAAAWEMPFTPTTDKLTFRTAKGKTVKVAQLAHSATFNYASVDGWQAVRLPYKSPDNAKEFSALFILPPSNDTALTLDIKKRLLSGLKPVQVDLQMPKIKLRSTTDLKPVLEKLQVKSIFDHSTKPLLGVSTAAAQEDLEVSSITQQAMIDVTEQGTVAAAVTEVGISTTALPVDPVKLVFDRPYTMLILHDPTNIALFQTSVREL